MSKGARNLRDRNGSHQPPTTGAFDLEHRAAIEGLGPIGVEAQFSRNQLIIMGAKHQADQRLWEQVT